MECCKLLMAKPIHWGHTAFPVILFQVPTGPWLQWQLRWIVLPFCHLCFYQTFPWVRTDHRIQELIQSQGAESPLRATRDLSWQQPNSWGLWFSSGAGSEACPWNTAELGPRAGRPRGAVPPARASLHQRAHALGAQERLLGTQQ